MDDKQTEKTIRDILDRVEYLTKNEYGTYEGELYADYRDEMSDQQAIKICEADDPDEEFCYFMSDAYGDAEADAHYDLRKEVEKELISRMPAQEDESKALIENTVEDMLADLVSWKYPDDHFLAQSFQVTIIMDTGDGNEDFTSNSLIAPCYYADSRDIRENSSLLWCSRQQGYTKEEFQKAMSSEEPDKLPKFLKSCREELENLPSHVSALAFLVEMPLRELIALNKLIRLQDTNGHKYNAEERPYCGCIVLDKDVTAGLYDPWNGSGSLLEIQLEKDVVIPIRFIYSALPDAGDRSVKKTYGMSYDAWGRHLKEIIAPDKKELKALTAIPA